MGKKREIYNDGCNAIEYKPNTKKVVIGRNVCSRFKSSYRSFKAISKEDAMQKGLEFLNIKL